MSQENKKHGFSLYEHTDKLAIALFLRCGNCFPSWGDYRNLYRSAFSRHPDTV